MSKKYVIGVDFGTLSARAVLFELATGEEVAESVFDYPHGVMDRELPCGKRLPPKFALQHPQDYLDALKNTVGGVLANTDPAEVGALGLDFTTCTILPVDENLTPLCMKEKWAQEPHAYVKLWKHHGAVEEAEQFDRVAQERKEPWMDIYGNRSSSEWMFPKIMETLHRAPAVYEETYRFLEAADWLDWLMTGQETHNASMAGLKSHWNKETGYPSDEFLTAVDPGLKGIVGTKVAKDVQLVDQIAGTINEQGAAMTGLLVGTPVAMPLVDANAALAGLNITREGDMMLIMGTSSCHITNTKKPVAVPGASGYVDNGMLPGLCTIEAGQAGVGDCFDWFTHYCVPQSYTAEAEGRGISIHALLREKAQKLQPGESRLLALDWWSGNRSVLKKDNLTGMILGLNMQTRPEEIYRALIEATAYGTRMIIENYENHGIPVTGICAAGGIAQKDPMMMQIYADVTGREIRVGHTTQAAARGIAMYAAVAAGAFDDVLQAAAQYAREPLTTYRPVKENQQTYEALYQEYRILHDYFGRGGNRVMERLDAIAGKQD